MKLAVHWAPSVRVCTPGCTAAVAAGAHVGAALADPAIASVPARAARTATTDERNFTTSSPVFGLRTGPPLSRGASIGQAQSALLRYPEPGMTKPSSSSRTRGGNQGSPLMSRALAARTLGCEMTKRSRYITALLAAAALATAAAPAPASAADAPCST